MEMNPFKPIIQFYEEFHEKIISIKMSLSKPLLKINLIKATT